ncbi:MAG: NAD(P)H-quinone oxidoreductase [Acidobacteria bacterium]|nr:NAD(P)H-quinone oxidoreductase [Acidobacteriota bacterium]MSO62642.1 NAD(P)H-quinone oxidoreductase [Acidobacteriota bacterium]
MRVVEISQFGPPEVLKLAERPDPIAGPGEVLVDVAAAGVNRPDVIQRLGKYPPPPGASDLPGLEVAGIVAALGAGVSSFAIGDEVCALVAGGGYAERVNVPQEQCLPVPRGLSMIEAAAIPETYFTVWTNVFERGELTGGESILIHGGTSGIGTTAIQLAHAFGARVLTTAGTDEKCEAARALGADHAFNYQTTDWVAAARQATGGHGVNMVLDIVGGDYIGRNLDLLASEGRLVQIAFLKSPKAELDFSVMMRKRAWITGSTLRPRTPAEKGAIAQQLRHHVWPLLEARVVRPIIHQVFPLAQAADAHRLMEAGTHIGKLVLDTRA